MLLPCAFWSAVTEAFVVNPVNIDGLNEAIDKRYSQSRTFACAQN